MATNMTVKLRKGGRVLDLNDLTNYKIAPGFTPPAVLSQPVLAAGGSANRNQGSKLIDKSAVTRQWSFGLHIVGSSEGEVSRRAETLAGMLAQAGSQDEPLFLEYRASSAIAAEPQWGQYGAARRYEITHAQGPTAGAFSGPAHLRAQAIQNAQINLTIAPYAIGKQQALCSAVGGVIEDVLGTVDGNSRGTVLPNGTTNVFSNPVFGNASYLTSWTAQSALITTQISDVTRTYPGCANAVRITSSDSMNNYFYQNVTLTLAVNYTLQAIVRQVDGSAVGASQMALHYSPNDKTTTFEALGNGLYRAYATFSGNGISTATGFKVESGQSIEVLAMQVEASDFPTPIAVGDFLGHQWSGTAHAASSTSGRTSARARLAISETQNASVAQGSIRMVVRPWVANTHPNSMYFFDMRDGSHTSAPYAYFKASDDKIYFVCGSTSLESDAQTFSPFAVLILHFTWGPSGMALYVNGSSVATGSYVPAVLGTYLYWASDYVPTATDNFVGTVMDASVYAVALTAAEVSADYDDITPLAANALRVGALPWLHTKDGDDTVDNCIDTSGSTGAPHENFAVMGAIPGSAPADTIFNIDPSSNTNTIYLSNWAIPYFLHPLNTLYFENSGTAGAVTDSTANYRASTAVGTTATTLGTSGTAWESNLKWRLLAGREFYLAARLYDVSGSNLTTAFQFYINNTVSGGESVVTQFQIPKTISTLFFGISLSPSLVLPSLADTFPLSSVLIEDAAFLFVGKRTTGSADVRVDYIMLMPAPMMTFSVISFENIIKGRRVTQLTNNGGVGFIRQITGDIVELLPGQFNVILLASHCGGVNTTVQETVKFTQVLVTPRYMLF